jgi:hypothetical protein
MNRRRRNRCGQLQEIGLVAGASVGATLARCGGLVHPGLSLLTGNETWREGGSSSAVPGDVGDRRWVGWVIRW